MKVLIVDDDPDVRSFLLNCIGTMDCDTVDTAETGEEALGRAVQECYDLVTLDLKMPEAGGVEIAELFKDQALKTPVLVISGFLEGSIVDQLRDAGIEYTLSKPFRRRELIDTVEAAIAS